MAQLQPSVLRLAAPAGPADEMAPGHRDACHPAFAVHTLLAPHELERFEALSTLGQLVIGAAHDLENVVTGVAGHAHLILERADVSPEVAALAKEILDASRQGARLAHALVRLGGPKPRRVAPVDVGALVLECSGVLRMAARAGVTIQITAQEPSARAHVDPSDLERILLNLVINARDAIPPQGGIVHVTVSDSVVPRPNGSTAPIVVIEVRDTGLGMDATTMSRMFEPFFTTKGKSGTGLGLAVVQQLVSANGGFLEVESAMGQGTRVCVCLPRASEPADA